MTSKALVAGFFGARGTGKTVGACQFEARTPCLGIWDYKHDPRLADWGTPYTNLAEFIRALEARTFTARYLVDRSGPLPVPLQFERFCQACFLRGNMRMFVDELPAVTRTFKAPDAWRECVNIGREYRTSGDPRIKHLGITITAQRLNEIDKTLIGNLDVMHCGRLPFKNDAVAAAGSLGVPASELMQLPDLHWIERRSDRTAATRGVLTFGNSAQKKATSGRRAA